MIGNTEISRSFSGRYFSLAKADKLVRTTSITFGFVFSFIMNIGFALLLIFKIGSDFSGKTTLHENLAEDQWSNNDNNNYNKLINRLLMLLVHGACLKAHDSWRKAHGSWLKSHGALLLTKKNGARGIQVRVPARHFFLGLSPWAMNLEPWALSLAAWAMGFEPCDITNNHQ